MLRKEKHWESLLHNVYLNCECEPRFGVPGFTIITALTITAHLNLAMSSYPLIV